MDKEGSQHGLAKLLPKAISSKRRRRKQPARDSDDDSRGHHRLLHRGSTLGSEDTASSSTMTGDDDDRDDRSFGSYESSLDREREREPSLVRPTTISSHPSLIGYLTTSSPEVQAAHLDSLSEPQHLSLGLTRSSSSAASRGRSPAPSEGFDSPSHPTDPPAKTKSTASSPSKRSKSNSNLSNPLPRTPPNQERPTTPSIINTPPTPTDAWALTSEPSTVSKTSMSASSSSLADGKSSDQASSAHSRRRSGSIGLGPSKLSNVTSAPLTPTLEDEEPTPSAAASTGFFSSMFSAAQTAANNLTNNIQSSGINLGGGKGRSTPSKPLPQTPTIEPEVEPAPEAKLDNGMEEKESAVQTLGAGDLSLSHLGLADPASTMVSPSTSKFPDLTDTRMRSESAPADAVPGHGEYAAEESVSRPRSLQDINDGDRTPPLPELMDKSGVQRTASVKSAMMAHRKRGSSVTATGAGAALGLTESAPTSTVIHPNANFSTPKLTGFAIASKKRNRDFHTLFKSVPDDDYLIEDYSCALQREILAHGRLYVSEGHLCFSSNILGWTTTLVMSFDEIVSVEKRSTALLFKNGLMISTLHAKHIFASFTSRDATYDLIVNIWKLGHPTLTSTLNGVRLEGTGGDKTEKIDADQSGHDSESPAGSETDEDSEDDEDDFYDEENDAVPETQITDLTLGDGDAGKTVGRKASGMTVLNGATGDQANEASAAVVGATDFPGPATHAPTDCGDSASHYDKLIGDEVVAAPLGKVFNLLWGAASPAWMSKWLTQDQKCTELQMEDKKGLSLENRTRTYSYIKPLYASIGPKQTKCIVSETLDSLDFEKAINLSSTTQTPDVPSGNVFSVKTKYCLSWAENNSTRLQVNCTVEWTGKSWLKGPIEKGCVDGQTTHNKDILVSLRAAVSSQARPGAVTNGVGKGKKKGKKGKALQPTADVEQAGNKVKKGQAKQSWGLLEPVRPLLEPVSDALRPVFTGNVMYGILVGLLVAAWFGFGFMPGRDAAGVNIYGHERHMVYDALWRLEEHELWDWLEERVGLERLSMDGPSIPRKALEPRTVKGRLGEEKMRAMELEEALRVTEEKLKMLKGAVGQQERKQSSQVVPDELVGETTAS